MVGGSVFSHIEAGYLALLTRNPGRMTMQSPDSQGLIKVGALTCTPANGHVNGVWAPLLNPVDGRPRRAAMRFTHVWDADREQAERFASQYGLEVVERYADLIGKVDGVILGNQDEVGVFKHLLRPYLEPECRCSSTGPLPLVCRTPARSWTWPRSTTRP